MPGDAAGVGEVDAHADHGGPRAGSWPCDLPGRDQGRLRLPLVLLPLFVAGALPPNARAA
jgi:hypothetical protein